DDAAVAAHDAGHFFLGQLFQHWQVFDRDPYHRQPLLSHTGENTESHFTMLQNNSPIISPLRVPGIRFSEKTCPPLGFTSRLLPCDPAISVLYWKLGKIGFGLVPPSKLFRTALSGTAGLAPGQFQRDPMRRVERVMPVR